MKFAIFACSLVAATACSSPSPVVAPVAPIVAPAVVPTVAPAAAAPVIPDEREANDVNPQELSAHRGHNVRVTGRLLQVEQTADATLIGFDAQLPVPSRGVTSANCPVLPCSVAASPNTHVLLTLEVKPPIPQPSVFIGNCYRAFGIVGEDEHPVTSVRAMATYRLRPVGNNTDGRCLPD